VNKINSITSARSRPFTTLTCMNHTKSQLTANVCGSNITTSKSLGVYEGMNSCSV